MISASGATGRRGQPAQGHATVESPPDNDTAFNRATTSPGKAREIQNCRPRRDAQGVLIGATGSAACSLAHPAHSTRTTDPSSARSSTTFHTR